MTSDGNPYARFRRALQTGNEVRNEPIRRVNKRLGYRGAPGRILFRGPLSPSAGA